MIAPRHRIWHFRISSQLMVCLVQHSTETVGKLDQKLSLSVALAGHISAGMVGTRMGRRVVAPLHQMRVEGVAPGRASDAPQVGTD
jgi:hypothetical protein